MWDKGLQPDPSVKYTILKRRTPYQPGSRNCDLCLSEKVAIMGIRKDKSYLNTNSELKKTCIHKYKHKLINLVTSSAQ